MNKDRFRMRPAPSRGSVLQRLVSNGVQTKAVFSFLPSESVIKQG